MIKHIVVLLTLSFLCCFSAIAQNDNAATIFKKATHQLLASNIELELETKETRSKGRVREKRFNVLLGTFGAVEKIRTIVQKPERSKGVTIVINNDPNETGLIEIFTPANGKIRKLKANQRNLALVSDGFGSITSNYATKNQDELIIKLIEKQQISGTTYYKLSVSEKGVDKKEKSEFLIEERTFHIVEIITYDKNDVKKSSTKFSDFETIQNAKGKIQPKSILTKNLKNDTQNEIKILEVTLHPDLKEEDFDIQSLRK